MSVIEVVHGRQIIDSRGNPTVEVEIMTSGGVLARASVPSGASTGRHEAVELRDGDKNYYRGKSVLQAVENINGIIAPELEGLRVFEQEDIDRLMIEIDGTENKSKLGANAILGVSLAVARAAAEESNLPLFRYIGGVSANTLPVPLMNILNGGKHADNGIDFQEFMIMPVGVDTFSDALQVGAEIFYQLKDELKAKGLATNVGDEGGFAPDLRSNEEAIEVVIKSIEKAGYKPGQDVYIALDAAATEMYNEESDSYKWYKSTGKEISSDELVEYWVDWSRKYPILSIEDAASEDDWEGWKKLTGKIGDKVQLVGDDLFVTNTNRLKRGIEENSANSILIKVNQIGTLTETIEAVNMAHRNGMSAIISHRSGETEDTFIADLAVALNTGQIKTGSMSRTDRVGKYNQLLRIEEILGENAFYYGKSLKFLR